MTSARRHTFGSWIGFAAIWVAGPACVQDNVGQKAAESCDTYTCPVGTAREELREVRSTERDVSDGTGPSDGQSGGQGVAFFSEGECSFTCSAHTECPTGTWPVITRDCFTCALLDEDGQVIGSECEFDDVATGDGGGGDGGGEDTGIGPPERPGWEQVASGAGHGCGLYTGGSVQCWGDSKAPIDTVYTTISAGAHGTCGLTSSGAVVCWGVEGAGSGSASERALINDAPTGSFSALSVGDTLACVLDFAGQLTCWGSDTTTLPGPFDALSVGGAHGCAVASTGQLDCFGDDSRAQASGAPSGSFESVAAGAQHSCAVATNATASCWTLDESGESSPPPGVWQVLSAGDRFTCGIDDTQSVQCWGRSEHGTLTPPSAPAVAVSVGTDHACAAMWDGTVACWGADDRGQAAGP